MTPALTIGLRRASDDDSDFFRAVYASTRAGELAVVPWDEASKAAFVDHQFTAQSVHYAQHYPDAQVDVVTIDGEPAGRLYVNRRGHEIRVVDIALLPEFRGRGVATALFEALFREARSAGRVVSIHVEQNNPARRLYERLGFVRRGRQGIHVLMEWSPAGQPNTAS